MKADISYLKKYMPPSELKCLLEFSRGEAGEVYERILAEIEQKIRNVPPIYANEELGTDASIALHYFGGATDIWISELDQETGEGFGYICLNGDTGNAELGYISIPEIVKTDMLELDLHWDGIKRLKDVMER